MIFMATFLIYFRELDHVITLIIGGIIGITGTYWQYTRSRKDDKNDDSEDGLIRSAEHGHYHPAPGTTGSERPPGPAPPGKEWSNGRWQDLAVPGLGRPPGPAPAGKVWNEEHGHWHDADGARPPGPAPVGKVWNEEHGHWHDADGAEPAGEFQIPVDTPEDGWTELPEADASYSEEEP